MLRNMLLRYKVAQGRLTEAGEHVRRLANMTTAKERIFEIIEQQPDDSTYEEILRELAFARMIDSGLEDSRAGRTISNEEAERRIRSWQR